MMIRLVMARDAAGGLFSPRHPDGKRPVARRGDGPFQSVMRKAGERAWSVPG
ncbi:hypothetical protein Q4610_15790 [Sphingobium sp. HBC34]|uniref:Uncharacterized protein n=1 Tax=Sphingobium cyanobacteriorum TaxID=3063954 RepID=A0ABT8ZPY6_9SPHN|nr:hypothetical protein [Sphingobium sp. HBC34]MDO7836508.1 hypothetical protein [Sphingobium sp. HBC34]